MIFGYLFLLLVLRRAYPYPPGGRGVSKSYLPKGVHTSLSSLRDEDGILKKNIDKFVFWTVFEAFFNVKIIIFSRKQGAMLKKFSPAASTFNLGCCDYWHTLGGAVQMVGTGFC